MKSHVHNTLKLASRASVNDFELNQHQYRHKPHARSEIFQSMMTSSLLTTKKCARLDVMISVKGWMTMPFYRRTA